jgi:hypothetical protein
MSKVQFRNIDLNLLIPLKALLHERNVTRAAERIHLSQSAMSRAPHRLRGFPSIWPVGMVELAMCGTPTGRERTPQCRGRLHLQAEQLVGPVQTSLLKSFSL